LLRSGRLHWEESGDVVWEESWFSLGALQRQTADSVAAFWSGISAAYIRTLCHVADPDGKAEDEAIRILDIPLPEEAERWLDTAPPMPGGEYLDRQLLSVLWTKLLVWCAERVREEGSIAAFLHTRAPQWHHVGRVFFHLAENRMNETYPFAFLATYATGLNDRGQPRHIPLGNALRRYVAASDKPALLRLLEPVRKAGESVPWVRQMVEDGSIFQPCPWTPDRAWAFLQSADELTACGLGIRLPDWWKKRRPLVGVILNTRKETSLGAKALLDVDVCMMIGDQQYSVAETVSLLEQGADGLVFFKGQWVELDREKLRQALEHWQRIRKQAADGELNFIQGMRLLAGIPDSVEQMDATEEIRDWSMVQAGRGFDDLLAAAREDREEVLDIPGLRATLRPYQVHGVKWLSFLDKLGLGACLADDMGLGKTIQILAFLLKEKQEGKNRGPTLLVVPASLLGNWQREAARFAPDLRLCTLHRSAMSRDELERYQDADAVADYDLVLTSYTGCSQMSWLSGIFWKRVIVDEAQTIKNAATRQSRVIRSLASSSRIAMTGTPVENSLSDLWTLFDFLNPGLLGNAKFFLTMTKKMEKSQERFAPLRRLTAPYILRRMKADRTVIECLPDKTEIPLYCQLTKEQARLYMQVIENLKYTLFDFDASPAARAKRHIMILQSMMLLKQICNHPSQAGSTRIGQEAYTPEASGKFLALGELCTAIAARQEKLLVFTQFREMVDPLAAYLKTIFDTDGLSIHGGVPVKKRQGIVNAFQTPDGPPFLILTLKVGGTGLTLTAASHVIHFDRWWNPAVEDQATDRAYRIGQKQNVLVHKCITRGTLEEKIDALIQKKRGLADEVVGTEDEVDISNMTDDEILDLVRLDVQHILE